MSRGAVDKPTTFCMQLIRDGFVEVELEAEPEGSGQLVDIGAQGFGAGVKLRLDHGHAWIHDTNRPAVLREVYGTRDGAMHPVVGSLDRRVPWLVADLDRFSTYIMASN